MPNGGDIGISTEPLSAQDPTSVGPYRLLSRLGVGGMGRVYLARSPGGRLVAVKVVHEYLVHDPDFRGRFRHEVLAAQRVSGAFTAPVVDADPDAPIPWLATSFLDAPTLAQSVATRGPMPTGAVRELGAGLAEALASIHRAGVIHRDLKPSNVLMAADGPRLIDFGIAHALDASSITRTGELVGSPGYVCPERLLTGTVTEAADVYALGAVLCFAATGRGPNGQGDASMIYYRTVHSDPDLDGITDPFLLALITGCLAKDPADRPTTADLLQRLNEPPEVTVGPATEPEPVPEPELPRAPQPEPEPATELEPESAASHSARAVIVEGTADVPIDAMHATESLHSAPTYIAQSDPELQPAAPTPTQPSRKRRRAITAAGSALLLGGAAVLVHAPSYGPSPYPSPSTDLIAVPGFVYGLDATSVNEFMQLWSTGSDVVVGSTSGLAEYDPATGKQLWSWPVPSGSSTICGMSQDTSEGIGLVNYGTSDGDCGAMQAVGLSAGTSVWAQPVSLYADSDPGVAGLTSVSSVSLAIGGSVATGPFLPVGGVGDAFADSDLISVAASNGAVHWSSDSSSTPLPDNCTLLGNGTQLLDDTIYTFGSCVGSTPDRLLAISPLSLSSVSLLPVLAGCDDASSTSITVGSDYLAAGCFNDSGSTLYTLAAHSKNLIPVDLTGVDISWLTRGAGNPTNGQSTYLLTSGDIMYLREGQNYTDDGVIAVNMATGKQVWKHTFSGNSWTTLLAPTSAGLVVASGTEAPATSSLYNLSASNGAVVGSSVLNDGELAYGQHSPDQVVSAVSAGSYLAIVLLSGIAGNVGDPILGILPLPPTK
jgi:serine/threonine protein kinase/outer membrane protein assembly factor BamB